MMRRVTATSIVVFGDTRRNLGQRAVAEKFAQIAVIGAAAIVVSEAALASLQERLG